MDVRSGNFSVEQLLELSGADRSAKAYAFLYAAFKQTEVSENPIRDALDCLTPFVAPYFNTIAGKQVNLVELQSYLKSKFGFDIPLYAIDQLIGGLQKTGYVEYNRSTRTYFAKKTDNQYNVAKEEIETEFDAVESSLARYADGLKFPSPPPSGTWGDALINFLKDSSVAKNAKIAKIKGALIDPAALESVVVGNYIKHLAESNQDIFGKLVKIFLGVLVEDFISSVSEIGSAKQGDPVYVLYDTAVLLRLLGCSGKIMRVATEELTRYLQDLGFRVYYLSGNEAEISGILNTIIYVKDSGKELEGETAQAIASGEVSITDIRLLQNTVTERLAALNVFSAENLEQSAQSNAQYQIDEAAFAAYLLDQAKVSHRAYSPQNRQNDASYLGTIMRLRRKLSTNDFTRCGYLFVTSNKFLAQASRRFLIQEKIIRPQTCPPMLSVGQVATIAWLMKDKKLEPEKAGKELLSNCFAAVRPDAEWFGYFRAGMEKITGSLDEYTQNPTNALTLQAARRIAQEESMSNTLLVRELSMAEILQRAEAERLAEEEKLLEDRNRESERQRAEIEAINFKAAAEREALIERGQQQLDSFLKQAEIEKNAAMQSAAAEATKAAESRILAAAKVRAEARADAVLTYVKVGVFIIFCMCLYFSITIDNHNSYIWLVGTIISGFITCLGVLDLLRIKMVDPIFSYIRNRLISLFHL